MIRRLLDGAARPRERLDDDALARRFGPFEPAALATVLEAVAETRGRPRGELRPRDPVPAALRPRLLDALARRGLHVDLEGVRTLRHLVGRVVPLLEERAQAHH